MLIGRYSNGTVEISEVMDLYLPESMADFVDTMGGGEYIRDLIRGDVFARKHGSVNTIEHRQKAVELAYTLIEKWKEYENG